MPRPPRSLLPLLALLPLAACAGGQPAGSLDSMDPTALLGHVVLSADGTRELGEVEDVVVGPDGRTAQVHVVSSTPMYHPMERRVLIDATQFRFSRNRNGLLLTGMDAQQFASLPGAVFSEENVLALGPSAVTLARPYAQPTNWSGVAAPPRR